MRWPRPSGLSADLQALSEADVACSSLWCIVLPCSDVEDSKEGMRCDEYKAILVVWRYFGWRPSDAEMTIILYSPPALTRRATNAPQIQVALDSVGPLYGPSGQLSTGRSNYVVQFQWILSIIVFLSQTQL